MRSKDISIAFICNAVLLGLLCADALGLNLYLRALFVNLAMYVVPGTGWLGIMRRHVSSAVFLLFFQFVLSVAALIVLHLGFLAAGHVPDTHTFLVGLLVLTNAGILVSRPAAAFAMLRFDYWRIVILGVTLVCVYTCVFAGMRTLPGQLDLDGEHQGTAYGIVHEFRPYLTSDIIASPYYFAHPPLTNIFNAYSTLLLNRTEDYRYFYETAKQTERVLGLRPGGQEPVSLGPERGSLIYFQGSTYVFRTMRGNDMLDRPISRQRVMEHLAAPDQKKFFDDPRPFPARASNIFASLFVLCVLFQWITKLTNSRLLGIVAGFVYVFSPGIFIRSCFSEHVAFTNALLVVLAYQFCFPEEFRGKGRWGGLLAYVPGLIAGLINQKIVIMVAPVLVMEVVTCLRQRGAGSWAVRLVKAAPIPAGFAAGTVLFWIYGLAIDPAAFFISHLRTHFFDRLLHLNTMFGGDYPGAGLLWYQFNHEFPPFLLSVFAVLYSLKSQRNRTVVFLTAWAVFGGVLFSVVDWKQTNHLTQLTIPLLAVLMMYIEQQPLAYKRVLKVLVGLCLLYGFWFDMQLLADFHFYKPVSGC